MKISKKLLIKLLIVCVTALVTFMVGRTVKAAVVWSHKWAYSTFAIELSIAGSMATYMNNSATDYTNNTHMKKTGTSGVIRGYEANFGSTATYQGYTYPSNASGQNCYTYPTPLATGNCNTTTKKAASAIIYYNTYYLASNRDWVARHEMGHVFGLYHSLCTDPSSVMYTTNCPTLPVTLQADEKNWINSNY